MHMHIDVCECTSGFVEPSLSVHRCDVVWALGSISIGYAQSRLSTGPHLHLDNEKYGGSLA